MFKIFWHLSIFTILTFPLYGQFNWEELEIHNSIGYKIQTITPSGKIIVYDETSGELYKSDDNGLAWEKIISCIDTLNCGFIDYIFKENSREELFVSNYNKVYRLDSLSNDGLSLVLQIPEDTKIIDFLLLESNKFVILTRRNLKEKLWKFSSDGLNIISEKDVKIRWDVKIFEGDNESIFVKYENEFLYLNKYDENLEEIFSKWLFPSELSEAGHEEYPWFHYSNGRFFLRQGIF